MGFQVYRFYRRMAFLGIALLVLIATISVISITGRALTNLGLKPVPGDFELVEIGSALAIFCFLPWTHLRRAHAVVDVFWGVVPPAARVALTALSDLLMLLLWTLLIWRMGAGLVEYYDNGETTFILLLPIWCGYALAMVLGVLGLFAYVWKSLESLGVVSMPPEFAVTTGGGHRDG